MTNLTIEQITRNLHLRSFPADAEYNAQIIAGVLDENVVFAGQGKNHNLVHVIAGESKGADQPLAVCGLWVTNKKRAPLATEKVCSKCTRGGTSFSRHNQPRECQSCGKMFADNASRDNTDQTCGACYEIAGHENAHMDGYHADQPEPSCPMCQERERTDAENVVETVLIETVESTPTDAETVEIVEAAAAIVADACYHCGEAGADSQAEIDGEMAPVHMACNVPQTIAAIRGGSVVTKADGTPKWRVKKHCIGCGRLVKVKRGTTEPAHKECREKIERGEIQRIA